MKATEEIPRSYSITWGLIIFDQSRSLTVKNGSGRGHRIYPLLLCAPVSNRVPATRTYAMRCATRSSRPYRPRIKTSTLKIGDIASAAVLQPKMCDVVGTAVHAVLPKLRQFQKPRFKAERKHVATCCSASLLLSQ